MKTKVQANGNCVVVRLGGKETERSGVGPREVVAMERSGMATRMAHSRVDEQEGPRRPSAWDESAPEDEILLFNAYGKGSGCAKQVHVLIRGDPDHAARRSGSQQTA